MARPRKPTHFDPPFHQAIRLKFIQFADSHEPQSSALRRLGTYVWGGRMTVAEWATEIHQGGTWLEEWAQDCIESWNRPSVAAVSAPRPWWVSEPRDPMPDGYRTLGSPCPPPKVESGRLLMVFPCPHETHEPSEMPEEVRAESRLFGGPTPTKPPRVDDFEANVKMAALYILCGINKQQLAKQSRSLFGTSLALATIEPRLADAMDLLQLKRKPAGRPPFKTL